MSTSFCTLSTYDVRSNGTSFGDMFRMPNHVHVQDTVGVKFFDNMFRGDSDGRNKKFRATGDDDVDQRVQVAFGIVDLDRPVSASLSSCVDRGSS